MARRGNPGAGRQSKGERELFSTRIPVSLATRLRDDADELDMSYSDLIGNILAAHYGLEPVAASQPADQERLIA